LFVKAEQEIAELEDSEGQIGYLARLGDRDFKLARCCGPRVDDEIVGHFNRNIPNTVIIHRADCHFIRRSQQPDNLINLAWLESIEPLTIAYLRLDGYDRGGLLQDISILLAQMGANITKSDISIDKHQLDIRLKLELQSEDDLIRVMHQLTNLRNVTFVQRMNSDDIQQWEK
jgi:GTP pyrophosphokinase